MLPAIRSALMKQMRIVLAQDAPEKIGVWAEDGTYQLVVDIPEVLSWGESGVPAAETAEVKVHDSGVLTVHVNFGLKYAFAPGTWLTVSPYVD